MRPPVNYVKKASFFQKIKKREKEREKERERERKRESGLTYFTFIIQCQ